MYYTGLPQYEVTKAHMPKEPDELSLQQAEVVLVLQEVDGKDTLQYLFKTSDWYFRIHFIVLTEWRLVRTS